MKVRKKLGLGVASAALGLALVGGGTWAAFNDVERIHNSFAAGTLDLEIVDVNEGEINFDLQNLKPGDSMERFFKLENHGTLAIKEVLMNAHAKNFVNGKNEFVSKHGMRDNSMKDFLKQFHVEILLTGYENQNAKPRDKYEIIKPQDGKTLYDLVYKMKNINLAPYNEIEEWTGIPINPKDYEIVQIKITMKDDKSKVKRGSAKGEYKQNVYQGDSVDIKFVLEATQWDGLDTEDTKNNGFLHKNEEAFSN